MNSTNLEYWSRAMTLAKKCVAMAREKNSFRKNEILAFCFAFRILNSSVSIKTLLENGLIHDSKSILRTLSDALIQLGGALFQPDFMDAYHMEGLERKDRIFKKMIRSGKWEQAKLTPEQKESQNKIIQELDRSKSVHIEKLAVKLDLSFEYYHLHNSCSSEIHHLPFTMQEYIKVDLEKKKVEFAELPAQEDCQLVLCAAYGCVLKMADFLNNHYKLGMEKSLKSLSVEGNAWFDKDEAEKLVSES